MELMKVHILRNNNPTTPLRNTPLFSYSIMHVIDGDNYKEFVINLNYFKRFSLPKRANKIKKSLSRYRLDKALWETKKYLLGIIPYYKYAIREGAKLNTHFRLFKYPNPDYFVW